MPARQSNSLLYNPNGLEMTLLSTCQRTIHASLERVWENILDWEHLPLAWL